MSDHLLNTESKDTRAAFIAILGKPNVGKSTLLNTLLGVKVAPISPKPQTTRKGVRGIYTDYDSSTQLVFVDTPGLHRSQDALGEFMNREVRNAAIDVDAILWVADLRRPPGNEDKDVARLLSNIEQDIPVYLIGNKVDVAKYPDEAIDLYRSLFEPARTYMLSALDDPKSVYALRDDLLKIAPESPYFFPENIRSDQSRETWAGEIVREAAMIHLRQEIPYAVAVQVIEWDDAKNEKEPIYISAEIWVEKAGHRMIAIGKGGKMIREIGKTARKQLEVFLSHQIYLNLEVVVHKNWREDRESLRELGYEN